MYKAVSGIFCNFAPLSYLILALFVVAALVFGYRALVVAPRAEKAAALIAEAQCPAVC